MTEPLAATADSVDAAIVPGDFITPIEAARKLRASKAALYEWLARGDIRHYRVGRLVRIRAADLAEYLERRRSQPPTRPSLYGNHPTQ
jgi:excisionase family DNA binding protein